MAAWNLRFDAEACLKHLPERDIRFLLATEAWDVDDWRIEIIPWKRLRIHDTTQHRYTDIYDVSSFYGGSLDQAMKRFLGKRKIRFDAAALNTDPKAWRDLGPIVEYCKRDAWGTKQLAIEASKRFVELGGSFDKPFSVAYVAADMLMRGTTIHRLAPVVEPHAEAAFFGGRFECLRRGRFEDAHAYDIKSAYPAHLVRIEWAEGSWRRGRRPHKDALHAVIRVRADVDPEDYPHMAPVPFKPSRSGPVVYPTGSFETTVLLDTYRRFEDVLTPLSSWSYIPRGEVTKPYKEPVERLVQFRADADPLMNGSAKKAANSIYGKLLNQRQEYRLVPITGDTDHFREEVVDLDGVMFRRERIRHKGLLYNPLHAGLITEGCRLDIWDACQRAGPEHALMILTDGVIFDGPVLGKPKAEVFGDLGWVAGGDTVIVGNGLYEIRGHVRRTRGVRFGAVVSSEKGEAVKRRLKGPSWFGKLRGVRGETVSFTDIRPAHMGEAMRGTTSIRERDGRSVISKEGEFVRNLGVKDVNVFFPFERRLNVCRDDKREWPEIGEARRLLKETFTSTPRRL